MPRLARYDWYQNNDAVILSIFIKKSTPQTTRVVIEDNQISGSIDEEDIIFPTIQLSGAVDPDRSQVEYLSTKIEITCVKRLTGMHWPDLESSSQLTETTGPIYPTSSKKKTDWDSYTLPADGNKDGEEDPLNTLFKQIYTDGNDETRKAMIKSFTESGGTCLSTNWKDVGKSKVDVRPPEGMEARSWTQP